MFKNYLEKSQRKGLEAIGIIIGEKKEMWQNFGEKKWNKKQKPSNLIGQQYQWL